MSADGVRGWAKSHAGRFAPLARHASHKLQRLACNRLVKVVRANRMTASCVDTSRIRNRCHNFRTSHLH